MKRVVLAIRNTLVCEAVENALKRSGLSVQKCLSQQPSGVAGMCDTFFADILLMDVNRITDSSFETRIETAKRAEKLRPSLKVGLLCDNVSDPEIAYKVKQAKEEGTIDVFFYESVPTDYLADIVDSLTNPPSFS